MGPIDRQGKTFGIEDPKARLIHVYKLSFEWLGRGIFCTRSYNDI